MTPCWYQWKSDWSKLCIPYCTEPSAMRSRMLSCLARSRMLSATAAVLISTSAAGTRPRPSLRGTRRSETIACSDFALRNVRVLVAMQELDRVLDRDDVHAPVRVHVIDHRG